MLTVYGCLESSANRRKMEKYAKFSGGLNQQKTAKNIGKKILACLVT